MIMKREKSFILKSSTLYSSNVFMRNVNVVSISKEAQPAQRNGGTCNFNVLPTEGKILLSVYRYKEIAAVLPHFKTFSFFSIKENISSAMTGQPTKRLKIIRHRIKRMWPGTAIWWAFTPSRNAQPECKMLWCLFWIIFDVVQKSKYLHELVLDLRGDKAPPASRRVAQWCRSLIDSALTWSLKMETMTSNQEGSTKELQWSQAAVITIKSFRQFTVRLTLNKFEWRLQKVLHHRNDNL